MSLPDLTDLRGLRERAGLSQAELAVQLDIDQSQISRIEAKPGNAPYDIVVRWLNICGKAKITDRQKMFSDFQDKYTPVFKRADIIRTYLNDAPPEMEVDFLPEFEKEVTFPTIREIKDDFEGAVRKAKVVVAGPFDVGKSFLLNLLLGASILPSRLSPTTSNVVLLKHIIDRPPELQHTCYLLRQGFNPNRWREASHVEEFTGKAGDTTLLEDHGQHDARKERAFGTQFLRSAEKTLGKMITESVEAEQNREDSYNYALVFADAPLLHLCELIDTPGLGHDASDTQRALEAAQDSPDVLIFCSLLKGFMDSTSSYFAMQSAIPKLKRVDKNLPDELSAKNVPPLRNLVVLATQAGPDVREADAEYSIDSGCYRLVSHLTKAIRREMKAVGITSADNREELAILRNRAMAFYIDVDGVPTHDYMRRREERPIEDVKELIGEIMPPIVEHDIRSSINRLKSSSSASYQKLGKIIEARIESFDKLSEELADRELREPQRAQRMTELYESAKDRIGMERSLTDSLIEQEARRWTDAEVVANFLKREYSEDGRSEAENGAIALISKRAMDNVSEELRRRVEQIVTFVREEAESIDAFAEPEVSFSQEISDSFGIVGGAAIGGAAATGLAVAVTAIPVTWPVILLGVGIGAAVRFIVGLFTSWQDRLAKKISKALKDNDFQHVLTKSSRQYWESVEDSILTAIEAADEAQSLKLERLRALVHDTEATARKLDEQFKRCGEIVDFFSRMPTAVRE